MNEYTKLKVYLKGLSGQMTQKAVKQYSSSSGANPNLGVCPNETTPDSPILRLVPGGEKADVGSLGWSQVSLNSAGPRVCRPPSSIPAVGHERQRRPTEHAWRWSNSGLARATCPNQLSLLERMISDSGQGGCQFGGELPRLSHADCSGCGGCVAD